jgi:hypothetical protein
LAVGLIPRAVAWARTTHQRECTRMLCSEAHVAERPCRGLTSVCVYCYSDRSSYGVKNGAGGVRADSALTSPSTSSMSSCGMAVSRFSSSNSGNSSENGDQSSEDHDSLSRDAALLAETVMLLQQGVYRASAKHAPARGSPSPVSSRPPKKGRARKQSLACRVKTGARVGEYAGGCRCVCFCPAPVCLGC